MIFKEKSDVHFNITIIFTCISGSLGSAKSQSQQKTSLKFLLAGWFNLIQIALRHLIISRLFKFQQIPLGSGKSKKEKGWSTILSPNTLLKKISSTTSKLNTPEWYPAHVVVYSRGQFWAVLFYNAKPLLFSGQLQKIIVMNNADLNTDFKIK